MCALYRQYFKCIASMLSGQPVEVALVDGSRVTEVVRTMRAASAYIYLGLVPFDPDAAQPPQGWMAELEPGPAAVAGYGTYSVDYAYAPPEDIVVKSMIVKAKGNDSWEVLMACLQWPAGVALRGGVRNVIRFIHELSPLPPFFKARGLEYVEVAAAALSFPERLSLSAEAAPEVSLTTRLG